MTRWIAPVLSFTAEEIWQHMPGRRGDSVFLDGWYAFPDAALPETASAPFWDQVIAVRERVSRELERLRVAGGIGSGLNAEVDLYCDASIHATLAKLGEELRFVLITSAARIHLLKGNESAGVATDLDGLRVQVAPSSHAKCVRCWHQRPEVGQLAVHPQLCGRCVENVDGPGEKRAMA
jgi:isoleucyl-tRNA synthetase